MNNTAMNNDVRKSFPLPKAPSSPVRLGLIGLGWVARQCHLPGIDYLRECGWPVEVSALCDLRADRLAAAAALYPEAKTFTSAESLFKSNSYDALLILTLPPSSCADLLEIGLGSRAPIFVEKPVSNDLDRVEQLGELADSLNCRVQVGYNRRHQPLAPHYFRLLKEQPGPNHLLARFWRTGRREDFFFENTASHPLDFLQSGLGRLQLVSAKMHPIVPGANIPACLRIDLCGQDPITLELDIRPAASRFEESYEAISTDRSVLIRYCHVGRTQGPAELVTCHAEKRDSIFLMEKKEVAEQPLASVLLSGFVHQMARFCQLAADSSEKSRCTLEDAANVLRLWAAISREIGWHGQEMPKVLTAV